MKTAYLFIFLLICSSCVDDEICVASKSNVVKIDFYDANEPTTPLAVTFLDILPSGFPEAFPDYTDSTLTSIDLTVDPNESTTVFIMETLERKDTLTLSYDIVPYLLSPTCGPQLSFLDLTVPNDTFDSLTLVNTQFLEGAETNINIYY